MQPPAPAVIEEEPVPVSARPLVATALLAVVLVGACSNAVTPVPASGLPSATLPSSAPATAPAPGTAGATAAPTAATLSHADPSLESLLPTTLQGVSLVRASQRGADLSQTSNALNDMLAHLGKTIDDFTIASAYSERGEVKGQIGIWRIKGAATARLIPEFAIAVQASSTTKLDITEITLGGKKVTQVGGAGQLTQGPLYAYTKDDMILFVESPDQVIAEEALTKMP
jgi:hypothetical protein